VIILAGIDTSTREKIVLKNDNYKGDSGGVHIGKYVHVSPNCIISGVSGGVYISDFCGLSANCKIYAFSHHYRSVNNPENRMIHFTPMCPQEEQCLIQGAVQIGENTGMALNVVILPGVSIPRNCFVAINSVVGRGKYSENTIISGDPAASGKPRFRPDA